ncbi:sensor histidine kinase [Nocardia sp. NPDC088792]|uniref:sensor histidine kinase n=1 Tax=Nocardia sp. NPDC088792 TaxID=3364332 RepID=UPI0037FF8F75
MTDSSIPTLLNRLLRLIGFFVVLATTAGTANFHRPWVLAVSVVIWVGWAIFVLCPPDAVGLERIYLCAMAIGSVAAAQETGATISALVAVVAALSQVRQPRMFGWLLTLAVILGLCVSVAIAGTSVTGLLGLLAGVAVLALMGWSRRQARISAEQNRLLVEQNRVIRAERDRAAALAERGRIARDMHDVLAHTLGGLVMQLDAADALLEAGEVDRAAERVRASHRLAVSGLEDARRVVGTLRSEVFDLPTELRRLAEEHRGAGGQLLLQVETDPQLTNEQATIAVARAIQESLTNARKHAPGQPVTLALRGAGEELEVLVSNPMTTRLGSLAASGVGAGLLGMRERLSAVAGTAEAGREGDRWTVRIRVPRR